MKYNYDKIWKETYGDMEIYGPTHRHIFRICSNLLEEIEYKSVVDVGCGMGYNLPLLCKNKKIDQVAGIDISKEAISKIKFPGNFKVMDIQRESLNEKFDLVFCSLILEHIENDVVAIKNIKKMANKYILITTISGKNFDKYKLHEETMGHVRNYHEGELDRKLQDEDITIIKKINWGFPFYSPIVRQIQNKTKKIESKFNLLEKIISYLLYLLFFLNSSKRGDILIILAKVS